MVSPRIGIVELIIILLTCGFGFGIPAILFYMLYQINARLKNIEEKLKDK